MPDEIFREPTLAEIPSVKELVAVMDETVAGLEKIKKRLAWTLRRHMVAGVLRRNNRPANLLVLGDSGTGKTYTLRALLDACRVIVAEVTATDYSDVGFVGRNLTSMYLGLAHPKYHGPLAVNADGNTYFPQERLSLMERFGVVVIDEFDKLRGPLNTSPDRQGAKMIAMQAELLKMAEGTDVLVATEDTEGFMLKTDGILHIACGAFRGLADQMQRARSEIPHEAPPDMVAKHVGLWDLVQYGFMEELVGRFATFIPLPQLKAEQVKRILHEQLIPKWTAEMEDHGLGIRFDAGAVASIISHCLSNPIGARALEPYIDSTVWEAAAGAEPGQIIMVDANAATHQRAHVLRKTYA